MISRRDILKTLAFSGAGGTAFGSYAVASTFRQKVTSYALTPPGWTAGLNLRLAVLADLHVCEPWMGLDRVEAIVEQTNALGIDAVLLLGDYVVGKRLGHYSRPVALDGWAPVLGKLKAPLGIHAVLGNHDWWEDRQVQLARSGPPRTQRALEAAGIPVYQNAAVRLEKDGRPFWIAGLGDQWAYYIRDGSSEAIRRRAGAEYDGTHDLPATLAHITDDAPVILMAHEPDIFPEVPGRVALTVAGHTHGGQVSFFGYTPIVPSRYGRRYVYGHKIEDGRHLIVSGGLGCSAFPVRLGVEPEIVVLELGLGETA